MPTRRIPTYHLGNTDSTQIEAGRMNASYATPGAGVLFALTADNQTAGMGRFDRRWEAAAGTCSLTTIVIRVKKVPNTHWASPLCALAARQALLANTSLTATSLQLKWPNDLMVGSKKLGGVLLTTLPAAIEGYLDIACGIGINTTMSERELPVATATSIAVATGTCKATPVIAAAVIDHVAATLTQWIAAGYELSEQQLHAYEQALVTIGKPVTATIVTATTPTTITGVFTGITQDGHARITATDGTRHTITAADVTLRTTPPQRAPGRPQT